MHPQAYERLREYIIGLTESQLWALLVEYFHWRQVRADIIHSTGEHGMDVVAFFGKETDLLGTGCNVVIQAKVGRLSLGDWRKRTLYQLLELPYYTIPHPNYPEHVARRVLLVVTDDETLEARRSIKEYNKNHPIVIDLWDLNDLISQFDQHGFATVKLEQITGMGDVTDEELPVPETVGEIPDAAKGTALGHE